MIVAIGVNVVLISARSLGVGSPYIEWSDLVLNNLLVGCVLVENLQDLARVYGLEYRPSYCIRGWRHLLQEGKLGNRSHIIHQTPIWRYAFMLSYRSRSPMKLSGCAYLTRFVAGGNWLVNLYVVVHNRRGRASSAQWQATRDRLRWGGCFLSNKSRSLGRRGGLGMTGCATSPASC